MAVEWKEFTANGYGQIGVEWHITTGSTSYNYAPTIHIWSKHASIDSYMPYSWSLKAGGSIVSSGSMVLDYNLGEDGYAQIDSFSTRTIDRGTSIQWLELTLTFSDGYIYGDGYINGTATWMFQVPPLDSWFVRYLANGGTGAPSTQTKYYGKPLTISSTIPSRVGYKFLGWTDTDVAVVTYAPGSTYTRNAALTLAAVWQSTDIKITYNANGGTGAPPSQTVKNGESFTISKTVPTRSGYNFLGWSKSSSASYPLIAPGSTYSGATADLTFYAAWEKEDEPLPSTSVIICSRCTSSGIDDDDGTYCRVEFDWTASSTPTIKIGYKRQSQSSYTTVSVTDISGTSGHVSKVVGAGTLNVDEPGDILITITDKYGTAEFNGGVWSAYYIIDIGKDGLAIGGTASTGFNVNIETTFSSPIYMGDNMDIHDKNNCIIRNGCALYRSSSADPNTTKEEILYTSHYNCPVSGKYYMIRTVFEETPTGGRIQYAFPYNDSSTTTASVYFRAKYGSSWTAWTKLLNDNDKQSLMASRRKTLWDGYASPGSSTTITTNPRHLDYEAFIITLSSSSSNSGDYEAKILATRQNAGSTGSYICGAGGSSPSTSSYTNHQYIGVARLQSTGSATIKYISGGFLQHVAVDGTGDWHGSMGQTYLSRIEGLI